MDLEEMWRQEPPATAEPQKVVINKQYIHSMRKRGVISETTHYPQPTPSRLRNKKKETKKKKGPLKQESLYFASREVPTEAIPLKQGRKSSRGLKTHSKSHKPHSLMHPHPHSA